jgi:hypothetical protein
MSTSRTEPPPSREAGPQVPRDLVAGLAMLAFVAVFLGKAGEVGKGKYDWLFPVVLSYGLAVLALVLVVRGLMRHGEWMPLVPIIFRGQGVDVAVFSVLSIAYVVVAPRIGFWIASALPIAVAAIYLETRRSWRSAAIAVLVGVACSVVGYLTLTEIFYIKFPAGPWGW